MSDGCEHTSWQCNIKDEKTGVYYDPNKPFSRFFDPLLKTMNNNVADMKDNWIRFIASGNESFINEPDDKTMILGMIK